MRIFTWLEQGLKNCRSDASILTQNASIQKWLKERHQMNDFSNTLTW